VDQFKLILNPDTGAYKGVGGFKSMGSIFPETWDWESFWNITAFFSIVLAFMNLLPIPALDGGHVLFTLVEMITKRKPSQKFLEYAQMAGMIILFGLLIYANANDFLGWNK
jgi:regulator of sigma E protease